ncbi:uncharacterized protein J3D65DRAFT_380180 [Phyllosticta citribraziliensis]|uniref:MYB transcription factor n=1 Tax=Phyllosticta citribraziliensis TaxID=989973 RepID=A0ABR1LS97_9PEZI
MSSSSKRNLKPTPLSASPSQLTVSGDSFGATGPGAFATSQQAAAAAGAGTTAYTDPAGLGAAGGGGGPGGGDPAIMAEGGVVAGAGAVQPPPPKKGRTNTPWTAAEEQRLKIMRDAGNSWSEIAKTFPTRTEGSVKKHWYKDMHYAEFAEDEVSPKKNLHHPAPAGQPHELLFVRLWRKTKSSADQKGGPPLCPRVNRAPHYSPPSKSTKLASGKSLGPRLASLRRLANSMRRNTLAESSDKRQFSFLGHEADGWCW